MEKAQEIKRAVSQLLGLTSQLQQLEQAAEKDPKAVDRRLIGALLEIQEKELKHIFNELL